MEHENISPWFYRKKLKYQREVANEENLRMSYAAVIVKRTVECSIATL